RLRHLCQRAHWQHRLRIEPSGELVVRPVTEEVRGDRRTDKSHEDEEDDEDAAADRKLVALEPEEDAFPVAASANRGLAELAVGLRRDGRRKPCAGRDELWTFGSGHGFKKSITGRDGRVITPETAPRRKS